MVNIAENLNNHSQKTQKTTDWYLCSKFYFLTHQIRRNYRASRKLRHRFLVSLNKQKPLQPNKCILAMCISCISAWFLFSIWGLPQLLKKGYSVPHPISLAMKDKLTLPILNSIVASHIGLPTAGGNLSQTSTLPNFPGIKKLETGCPIRGLRAGSHSGFYIRYGEDIGLLCSEFGFPRD